MKNIGLIDFAEIDITDITCVCGMNNTGKTYVTYAIYGFLSDFAREGANKQVISSQADSLIKISRIWADFFPANTSNQPI
ncbi:AAA family ATPase [Salmonella enterica subsp. enterica serovar Rissen]|nr:AAA family ATPase [Salmonella enterica subsp. enterica serovar Rissen]